MSDPAVNVNEAVIVSVIAKIKANEAAAKAEVLAGYKAAVVAFGHRAVYMALGAMVMFIAMRVL